MKMVPLGELIAPAKVRRAGSGNFPLLSMTMRDGLVDQSSKFKKRVASEDVSGYKVVQRGQLVVGFPIDEGVVDFQSIYDRGIVSPAYGVWDMRNPERMSPNYIKKFLRSEAALSYYKSKLRGSTARRRSLPTELFLALKVPLPSLGEQRRIAAILDKAAAIRALRLRSLTMLDELQQACFIAVFGDPGHWAARWSMATIADLAESFQYGTSEKSGAVGEFPILRMGNVTRSGKLDLTDLKYIDLDAKDFKKFGARRGDLLFNRTNSPELVGKTAVVDVDIPLVLAGYLVRVRFAAERQSIFVSSYLNSRYGKALLRGMAKGAINQANISASELKMIPIALPSGSALETFSLRMTEIAQQRSRIELQLLQINQLFASLQSRAFRGEL